MMTSQVSVPVCCLARRTTGGPLLALALSWTERKRFFFLSLHVKLTSHWWEMVHFERFWVSFKRVETVQLTELANV